MKPNYKSQYPHVPKTRFTIDQNVSCGTELCCFIQFRSTWFDPYDQTRSELLCKIKLHFDMSRNKHHTLIWSLCLCRQRNPHDRAIPLHLNLVPDYPRKLLTHYASKRLEMNRKAFTHGKTL